MNTYVFEKKFFDSDPETLLLEETLFHNANGYLGVRACFEERYTANHPSIRGQYLNGFYEIVDMPQAEKLYGLAEQKQTMLNVADTQTIVLQIAGETFSLFEGDLLNYHRSVDMRAGVSARILRWRSPKGQEVDLEIRRMASFVHPSLFLIDYSVTPRNFSGDVTFCSLHSADVRNYADPKDPRVADHAPQYLFAKEPEIADGATYLCADTPRSKARVCSGVANRLYGIDNPTTEFCVGEASVWQTLRTTARAGETVRLLKYGVFGDSLHFQDAQTHVKTELDALLRREPEQLYNEQRDFLQAFWINSDLTVDGDEETALAIHYNQYQLLQSAGRDDASNIPAKGLSGEGYEGHYFWDTEMYIQPFFLLTNPDIVKNLISYRYRILPKALDNARLLGHRQGALYAWRTIGGEECSGYYPSGGAQYHISGDIAYSVVQYYLATGDLEFIRDKGYEMVLQTARLWADMAAKTGEAYHIHCVTGPDEYTCIVNNNYYTNALAKFNLEWAVAFAELLGEDGGTDKEELSLFAAIADGMYLPYDETLGINPQDDAFLNKRVWDFAGTPRENYPLLLHYHPLCLYRHQVCKQADTVLSHLILEEYSSQETLRRSFDYYEKITTHDSSLSSCVFSMMAARLGLAQKAVSYFGRSAQLDLQNTHHNTKDGLHIANMGGTYMAVVYGFAGLRIKKEGLFLSPMIPEDWRSYRFRLQYQGRKLRVDVDHSLCRCVLLEGAPVELYLYGEKHTLSAYVEAGRAGGEV